ncbi:hypothetical protein GCK32_019334 [Trichostrongylus colubriformis]|uniref:Uncharacterized protein n=1 Tax=Trichostrongylus colubriformis TaxID=6319 RepID=A0AAN8IE91_TRICO
MILLNEGGHVFYINTSAETVILKFRANRTVPAVQFSPDGKSAAICRDMDLQIQEVGKQSIPMYYPFYFRRRTSSLRIKLRQISKTTTGEKCLHIKREEGHW